MRYIIYFNCPNCPKPCDDKMIECNELVDCDNKRRAREIFNGFKPCRWMKITRIESYKENTKLTPV